VSSQLHYIEGSLPDLAPAAKALRRFSPEAIFHLAWDHVSRESRDSVDHIRVNLNGGLRIVDLACDLRCRVFVGIGSQAEFGPSDSPLSEATPARPETAYGLAKLCLGQLALKQCGLSDVRAVWLRLLASYGPEDDAKRLIPYLILSLLRGETPVLNTGDQRWDYLYSEDAAEAMLAAALQESVSGAFNLAYGGSSNDALRQAPRQAWTVRQIATFLRDRLAPEIALHWQSQPAKSLVSSSDAFSAVTGWQPKIDMQEGLLRTAEWYRNHLATYEAIAR
jgi:nucleoside-diphosphate-sugar epimerase